MDSFHVRGEAIIFISSPRHFVQVLMQGFDQIICVTESGVVIGNWSLRHPPSGLFIPWSACVCVSTRKRERRVHCAKCHRPTSRISSAAPQSKQRERAAVSNPIISDFIVLCFIGIDKINHHNLELISSQTRS